MSSGIAAEAFRPPMGRGAYRIEASRRLGLNLRELAAYRDLLFLLVWRDVKVRYQQTLLGISWAVLQPLVAMFVFTIVFNRLGGLQPEYHVPYTLFVVTGLVPWFFFSSALSRSTESVVNNSELVSRVYFPRLIIPIASVFVVFVDFAVSFGLLVVMFLFYSRLPDWHVTLMPFFLGMAFLTALGAGLWFSALNVRYRDVVYITSYVNQILLFVSPVAYSSAAVPHRFRWLISLNPLTGVLDGFRWSLLGRGSPPYDVLGISCVVALGVAASGLWYFRRVERDFADVI